MLGLGTHMDWIDHKVCYSTTHHKFTFRLLPVKVFEHLSGLGQVQWA